MLGWFSWLAESSWTGLIVIAWALEQRLPLRSAVTRFATVQRREFIEGMVLLQDAWHGRQRWRGSRGSTFGAFATQFPKQGLRQQVCPSTIAALLRFMFSSLSRLSAATESRFCIEVFAHPHGHRSRFCDSEGGFDACSLRVLCRGLNIPRDWGLGKGMAGLFRLQRGAPRLSTPWAVRKSCSTWKIWNWIPKPKPQS